MMKAILVGDVVEIKVGGPPRCHGHQCKYSRRYDHIPGDDCFEPRAQLSLFRETPGEILTELCVDALTRDEPELRAIASDLLVLVRYHASKMQPAKA